MIRGLVALIVVASFGAIAACDGSELSPPHPNNAVSYPISVTADPSGRIAWVVSGNFNLAYRGSAVIPIDVLNNRFVPELSFEIGNFPGPLTIRADAAGQAKTGYIASRDDDAIYFVNFASSDGAPSGVSCKDGALGAGAEGILRCPKSGAVTTGRGMDDEALIVGDDPFELALLPSRAEGVPDLLVSAAMRDGTLSSYSLADDGTPTLVGNLALTRTIFGLAPDPRRGRIFATHKSFNAVTVLNVRDRNVAPAVDTTNPWLTPIENVQVNEFISTTASRDRARSAVLSADGSRLYVTFRAPDSLIVFDTQPEAGTSNLREIRKIPLSGDPGELALVPASDGHPELIFVSCFQSNRVEVIDPIAGVVVGGIRTGQGPSGLAVIENPELNIFRLYVALFNENAVGVIELDPSSPEYLTTIAEIR